MKMHENKLKRFGVYGKIADVLFIIIVVGGALLTLAGLAGAIYINVTDFDLMETTNFILTNELPGAELILPDDIEISYSVIYMIVVSMALSIALAAFAVKSIAIMFNNTVKEGTPFNKKSVRCMKAVGSAFIIYTGVVFVMSIITGAVAPVPKFDMTINGRSIIIGLLVLAFGEMFEFGMDLQEDNESIL